MYDLIGEVYKKKLTDGEYGRDNYTNYQAAVDDVLEKMKPSNATDDEKYGNWTPEMKEKHKKLSEYFKKGWVSLKDINFKKIEDIAVKIMKNIE